MKKHGKKYKQFDDNFDYHTQRSKKSLWKIVLGVVGLIGLFITINVVSGIFSFTGSMIQETKKLAVEELSPYVLLKKYSSFKDMYAVLSKKQSDIGIYEQRITSMTESYEGIHRHKWDRTDKEQFNQWQSELVGIKASFNNLAAQYNAQMAKMNYRFTNVGMLPEGASNPLPREFAPYL